MREGHAIGFSGPYLSMESRGAAALQAHDHLQVALYRVHHSNQPRRSRFDKQGRTKLRIPQASKRKRGGTHVLFLVSYTLSSNVDSVFVEWEGNSFESDLARISADL